MIFDETGTPKRPVVNEQDGLGERLGTRVYVNDQDGTGERLVWDATGGLLIASFEGAEFDDNWGGRKDTNDGDLTTTTQRSAHGETSVRHLADAGYDATRSEPGDGLPHYLGIPSQQRHYVYIENWSAINAYWQFVWRNNGNDWVGLRYWGTNNAIYINEMVGGVHDVVVGTTGANLPSNQWLEVTITVNGPDGTAYPTLAPLEPRVEIYPVDSTLTRTGVAVVDLQGADSGSGTATISQSNVVSEAGYRWTFQGSTVMDADYHHIPDPA